MFNVYEEKTIYVNIIGLIRFYIRRQKAFKKITLYCSIYNTNQTLKDKIQGEKWHSYTPS